MNSNVREIFSSHLGYLLAYSGKSQNDVARDLGVATGTVSSWVNGQKFPRADMVQNYLIISVFACPFLWKKTGLTLSCVKKATGNC